jgi:hypothetical protein
MARTEIWVNCELTEPAVVYYPKGELFEDDVNGNIVGVRVYRDHQPVNLTGMIVGYCVLANGTNIPVNGYISGNSGYVLLPASCYTVPGKIIIVIKNVEGSTAATLAAVVLTVFGAGDNIGDPTQTTIDAWTAMITSALTTIEGRSVRYDTAQSLTSAQKEQALSNMGRIYDAVQFSDDDYVIILP